MQLAWISSDSQDLCEWLTSTSNLGEEESKLEAVSQKSGGSPRDSGQFGQCFLLRCLGDSGDQEEEIQGRPRQKLLAHKYSVLPG